MYVDLYRVYRRKPKAESNMMINSSLIGRCSERQKQYKEKLDACLEEIQKSQNAGERWSEIQEKILEAANQSVGTCKRLENGRISNVEVEKLSEKQKQLRIQISNSKSLTIIKNLKNERTKILKEIQRINK